MTFEERLATLNGGRLIEVYKKDYDWFFVFDNGVTAHTECYWRVIANGGIAVSESDHGQKFGLPAPLDAGEWAMKCLSSQVLGSKLRDGTSDITIEFANGAVLELFNTSSGYEGWQMSFADGRRFIALGGGDVTLA